jgi:hypothetical protein
MLSSQKYKKGKMKITKIAKIMKIFGQMQFLCGRKKTPKGAKKCQKTNGTYSSPSAGTYCYRLGKNGDFLQSSGC